MLKHEDVYQWIEEQLKIKFKCKLDFENYRKTHFFSSKLQLHPRELIFLCMELEKHFNFKFTQEDFLSEQIYTVEGLNSIISKK